MSGTAKGVYSGSVLVGATVWSGDGAVLLDTDDLPAVIRELTALCDARDLDGALAPCPFCGSTHVDHDAGGDDSVIVCGDCLATGPVATLGCREDDADLDLDAEAASLWNHRR